jgi:hypothetical protein
VSVNAAVASDVALVNDLESELLMPVPREDRDALAHCVEDGGRTPPSRLPSGIEMLAGCLQLRGA